MRLPLLLLAKAARAACRPPPACMPGYRAFATASDAVPAPRKEPRRALMYVPGSDERKVRKAASLPMAPDTVCLDLEDGVAPSAKAGARDLLSRLVGELDFGTAEVAVRVNGPSDDAVMGEDLAAILGGGSRLPDCVVVPKVESADEVRLIMDRAGAALRGRPGGPPPRPPALITMMESGKGLMRVGEVFAECVAFGGGRPPLRLEGCILGGDDYAADVGATRTEGSMELLYARQALVAACAAYRIQAIDIVHIAFKDLDACARESAEGAAMGMAGKQVIHPGQIGPVHAAFAPPPEAVEYARELVEAADAAEVAGVGAFDFRGKMIDRPTVLLAQGVVARADAIAAKEG